MSKERDAVVKAQGMARATSEYANGYHSGAWISGRAEGFQLALEAMDGTLKSGQWNEYRPVDAEEG